MHLGCEESGVQWRAADLVAEVEAQGRVSGESSGVGEGELSMRVEDEAWEAEREAERVAERERRRATREAEERWGALSPGERERESREVAGGAGGGAEEGGQVWEGGWGWDVDTRLHTVWQGNGRCRETSLDWFTYFHGRRLEPLCVALRDEELATLCGKVMGRLDRYLDPRLEVRPALLHGHASLANVAGARRSGARAPLLLAPASWYGHGEVDLGALWRAEASSPGGEARRCADEVRAGYWDARGEVPGEAEEDRAAMYRLYHALVLIVAQERGSRGRPDPVARGTVKHMLAKYA